MSPKLKPSARSLALQILREVLGGHGFAAERLDQLLEKHRLATADRGLCTQLVYGVLREKGFLDQVLSSYVSVAKTPAGIHHLLRLAAYQCLNLDKIPDYAVVNESVELAKALFGVPPSRMVNAVLRKLIADRESLLKKREQGAAAAFPDWILERWRRRFSKPVLETLLQYFQGIPPVSLRVNLKKADPELLAAESALGPKVMRVPDTPILILDRFDREILAPFFESGKISVQDLHSYRVAEAVAALPGDHFLDACAGHGGKSAAILEAGGDAVECWVHEPAAPRLEELKENFRRLGLPKPRILDSAASARRGKKAFDRILIDAPCSGMGTLGRKPEIRWRLQAKDLPRLAAQQRKILEDWLPCLKPGGTLVYAVCSLEPEEGRALIEGFLTDHPDLSHNFTREWLPGDSPGDGFFVAGLRRGD